ncbi:MAG: 3-isopropylmalate dehydrogenase [bacterium]|nr:3-isopropylmalate dehydrogenase [bacterium]
MTYKIAVLPGDGIGPEVMDEALKVLKVIGKKYNLNFEIKEGHIGGKGIDECGTPLPEETQVICKESDAILLGSIGGPKWDNLPPEERPEIGGLLRLRKMLSLFANIRPVILFEQLKGISPLSPSVIAGKIDLVTVRELGSGIYFGKPREVTDDEGFDTMRYTRAEVEKIARVAFETASKRRKKVTSIDKANVLHSSMLWRRVVGEVAKDYPDVELSNMYIDNACMQMILNPSQFDVLLTANLFGDIISDESAAIAGSLGMLPSASLGDTVHLYEPAGGSAPDIAGKGIANPIAQILSVSLMLEYSFRQVEASRDILDAVEAAIKKGYRTGDIADGKAKPATTVEIGDIICKEIEL